jgi:signal transduction histidine kinase
MKELTYSDQINIETYKQLIKCLCNDIEDVKKDTAAPSDKVILIFKLTQRITNLIDNARKYYPSIKWTEYLNTCTIKIDRELAYNAIKNNKQFN